MIKVTEVTAFHRVIVFIFFGAGKLPNVMRDIGKSIRGLKDGMKDEKDSENKKDDEKK